MAKFSALCFSLLALAMIAGELTAVLSYEGDPCLEILPSVIPYCQEDKISATPECVGNCTQRHPNLITAFCYFNKYPDACVCEYPGPCHGPQSNFLRD